MSFVKPLKVRCKNLNKDMKIFCIFLCKSKIMFYFCSVKTTLGYGVMVTLQILVLSFLVRIQVAQLQRLSSEGRFFCIATFLFYVRYISRSSFVARRCSRVVPLHLSRCVWVADTSIAPKHTAPRASSPPATRATSRHIVLSSPHTSVIAPRFAR